jgi:hypothetical protein
LPGFQGVERQDHPGCHAGELTPRIRIAAAEGCDLSLLPLSDVRSNAVGSFNVQAIRAAVRSSSMKRFALVIIGCALTTSALAAPKSCEKLKAEIEAKIQANKVSSYTLEIVMKKEVHDQNMVVGTCEGGRKKIIYQKNDN